MQLILHAGAHKTGTTLIQSALGTLRTQLRDNGVHYIDMYEMKPSRWHHYLHPAKEDPALRAHFISFIDEIKKKNSAHTLLLSSESVFSYANLWGVHSKRHFYGDMLHAARRLRDLRLFEKIDIVFYVRRQDTFVNSVYLEYVKGGNIDVPFDVYFNNLTLDSLSWNKRIITLANTFGQDRIKIRLFEDIRKGADHFINDFLTTIGITGVELPPLDLEGSNRSLSAIAYEKAMAAFPTLDVAERRKLGRRLQKKYSNRDHPAAYFIDDKRQREILMPHIEGNREMFRRFLPDLDPSTYEIDYR